MSIKGTQELNAQSLRNRIDLLKLKREYIALEIGVDRNTLRRWLNGSIRRVKTENVRSLAKILKCDESTLVVEEPFEKARRQLEIENPATLPLDKIYQTFANDGQYELLESLLLQLSQLNLPPEVLGQLYNLTSFASIKQSKPQRARDLANLAIEAGHKAGDIECISQGYSNVGASYLIEHDVGSGIERILQAIVFSWQSRSMVRWTGAMGNACRAYEAYGNYPAGIRFGLRVLKYQSSPDSQTTPEQVAQIHNAVGMCYFGLQDLHVALNHFNQALKIARANKFRWEILRTYLGQALVWSARQDGSKRTKEILEVYFEKQEGKNVPISHQLVLARIYLQLGLPYVTHEYLSKFNTETAKPLFLATFYEIKGDYFVAEGLREKALYNYKQSMGYFKLCGCIARFHGVANKNRTLTLN